MDYCLRHYTHYQYEEPVTQAYNQLRMLPRRDVPGQTIIQRTVRIHPRPAYGKLQADFFGNRTLYLEIDRPHLDCKIFLKHIVRRHTEAPPALSASPDWSLVAAALHDASDEPHRKNRIYTLGSTLAPVSPALREFAAAYFAPGTPLLVGVDALMRAINSQFKFDASVTSVTTPISEVLSKRRGVCQDFAQLMIGALRSLGLAARYVSGYIETLPPPGQQRLVGADASHAWVSVWCPVNGWQDFDPTNDQRPRDQHIVCAWGRDYSDVIPLNGVVEGGGEKSSLKVSVDIARLGA